MKEFIKLYPWTVAKLLLAISALTISLSNLHQSGIALQQANESLARAKESLRQAEDRRDMALKRRREIIGHESHDGGKTYYDFNRGIKIEPFGTWKTNSIVIDGVEMIKK
jgi:hypothetical protein